jgi:hypothetical protein
MANVVSLRYGDVASSIYNQHDQHDQHEPSVSRVPIDRQDRMRVCCEVTYKLGCQTDISTGLYILVRLLMALCTDTALLLELAVCIRHTSTS